MNLVASGLGGSSYNPTRVSKTKVPTPVKSQIVASFIDKKACSKGLMLFVDYYLQEYGGKVMFLSNLKPQDVLQLNLRDPFLREIIEHWTNLNGRFAASGHVVQNPPCWRASCPLGHPEQSDSIQTNLHFLCFGCPSA